MNPTVQEIASIQKSANIFNHIVHQKHSEEVPQKMESEINNQLFPICTRNYAERRNRKAITDQPNRLNVIDGSYYPCWS